MRITLTNENERAELDKFLNNLEKNSHSKSENQTVIQALKEANVQEETTSASNMSERVPDVSLTKVCNMQNPWEYSECWNEDVPE
ncbi:hypothetical protein [Salsuginibacillus kocurii]|uniref:hypothetical protein n=1 Tax=Salsuginibacillus kocurii TaxID=427078 RepID=UPI00036C187C|nr:hypothetical protein [Salsuginibacillus kocurii]